MAPRNGRGSVVSSFTIVKGALISETYAAFQTWDLALPKRENLTRLRERNPIGARSDTWLRDVAKVLNRRFDPVGRDRPLVQLAKDGCDLEIWKPLLLWHMTRDEFLLRDFLAGWLYDAHANGVLRIRVDDVAAYLRIIRARGGETEHPWSESTLRRVAVGLLKMSVGFGLLRGSQVREPAPYGLPEMSFLYLLHAMTEALRNPRLVVESPDWRMFLMSRADVEREIFRLHQHGKLEFQVAGSLMQLTLPYASAREYVEAAR